MWTGLVNDVHSQLNPTRVARVVPLKDAADIRAAVRSNAHLSVAGGRHSMGGQQFGTDTVLLDTRSMNRILGFDREAGRVHVEAGIQWPELLGQVLAVQDRWGIAQKQTGADRLSIGGALSSNIHGRGLTLPPFVSDVESFTLVGADGELHTCSRTENAELFRLAVGGYGLFGVLYSVELRLIPRTKVERVVELIDRDLLASSFATRIADGYTYGDFQFAIDPASDDFLRKGIFSCYRPTDPARPIPVQKQLGDADWIALMDLAHVDPTSAFERYADYYLSTDGQLYWSDTQQLGFYPEGYHAALDRSLGTVGTEVITELYVPRSEIAAFLADVADDLRANEVQVVYGTIRIIERDTETFLPWAREPWACTVLNVHTDHTADGLDRSARAFRRLIDLAEKRGGSYFLTYHRHATREQVLRAYPRMPEFLAKKQAWDPDERFRSDWFRHLQAMFA